MATITRTTTFETASADLFVFEGFGASRRDRINYVGVSSAGHPHYNRRAAKRAGNGTVRTTMNDTIKVTDLSGTDWFSVTTVGQGSPRTYYLSPETVVVSNSGNAFWKGTLREFYDALVDLNRF